MQATTPHYKILWWDASWSSDTCGNSGANDSFPLSLIYSLASWRPQRPNKQTMPSVLKIWKCSINVFVSEKISKNACVRKNTVFQTHTKIMHTYGCLGIINQQRHSIITRVFLQLSLVWTLMLAAQVQSALGKSRSNVKWKKAISGRKESTSHLNIFDSLILISLNDQRLFVIYLFIYLTTYIHTYIHTYIRAYMHAYIHTHIHTYTRTYIHTYIQTDIHTYIRTYIHTCIFMEFYICTWNAFNINLDSGAWVLTFGVFWCSGCKTWLF